MVCGRLVDPSITILKDLFRWYYCCTRLMRVVIVRWGAQICTFTNDLSVWAVVMAMDRYFLRCLMETFDSIRHGLTLAVVIGFNWWCITELNMYHKTHWHSTVARELGPVFTAVAAGIVHGFAPSSARNSNWWWCFASIKQLPADWRWFADDAALLASMSINTIQSFRVALSPCHVHANCGSTYDNSEKIERERHTWTNAGMLFSLCSVHINWDWLFKTH